MKNFATAASAVVLSLALGPAHADTFFKTALPLQPTASTPGATDYLPLVQGGSTLKLPGNTYLLPNGSAAGLTAIPMGQAAGTLLTTHGGTGATSASGTALDNITGFASTGLMQRTGSGTYSFTAPASGMMTFLGSGASADLRGALSDETGTGFAVFATSPVLVTPNLGVPSAADLTNATNIPAGQLTGTVSVSRFNSGTGASTTTFLRGDGTWVAPAGGASTNGSASDMLTSNGSGGFGTAITPATGVAAFLAAPSSANLLAALTTKTGTGLAVFGTSPVLVTPNLGIPSAVDLTNATNVPGATLIAASVTNAKLANMAAHTFKGNNTGGTAVPLDLSATQLTAEINAFAGDSGSGALKGLVPAAAAGDAAASKVLGAGGTWVAQSSSAPTISDSHSNSFTTPAEVAFSPGVVIAGVNGGTVTVKPTNEISTQTGTTYTLQATDANTTVHFTNASPVTVTLLTGATLGNGFGVSLQCDAGCTVNRAGSDTINGAVSLAVAAHQTAALWSDGTAALGAVVLPGNDPSNASNLASGTVSINRFNSGTGAVSTTFLAGDGTWRTPAGSGSGVVNSGTANQFAYYATSGTGVSTNAHLTDDGSIITATQALALSGTGTPTALSGNVNDYNPSGLSTKSTLRIDGGAANRTITGIAGGVDGRILTIVNVGATNTLTFSNGDTGSTAANRFQMDSFVSIAPDGAHTFRYDGTTSRWRSLGRTHQPVDYVVGWASGVNPNKLIAFTAPRNMAVTAVTGTVGDAVGATATLSLFKAPTGTTCSSGTNLIAAAGTFDANGTAATNQSLTLSATASDLQLVAGDRVCLSTAQTTAWTGGSGNGAITITARAQ